MRPEDAYLLTPGTKVVIKNDFYKYPSASLRPYLGKELSVTEVVNEGGEVMVRTNVSCISFFIQEIDSIVGCVDCCDEDFQTVDIAELLM